MKILKIISIWIFTILFIINILFVPWIFVSRHERNRNTIRQAGYSMIYSPPTIPGSSSYRETTYEGFPAEFWSIQIDRYRLIIQSVAIIVLFSVSYYTLIIIEKRNNQK